MSKMHYDTGNPVHNHGFGTARTLTRHKRLVTCKHCDWKHCGGNMPYVPGKRRSVASGKPLTTYAREQVLAMLLGLA